MLSFIPKYICGLLSVVYLFTIGVFSARHRYFIYNLCRYFGWRIEEVHAEVPKVTLDSQFTVPNAVQLLETSFEPGNTSMMELLLIAKFTKALAPATVFEIGTFDGRTTVNIAANMAEGGKVWTLDLPAAELNQTTFAVHEGEELFINKAGSGIRFTQSSYAGQITQLYGDSAKFDPEPFAGQMDLVFVDASHAYEYVVNDTKLALRMIKPGGLILWHDYDGSWPGVTKALNEFLVQEPRLKGLRQVEGTTLVFAKV